MHSRHNKNLFQHKRLCRHYLSCLAGCDGCLLLGGGLATQPWGAAAAGLTPKFALFDKYYYYYFNFCSLLPHRVPGRGQGVRQVVEAGLSVHAADHVPTEVGN